MMWNLHVSLRVEKDKERMTEGVLVYVFLTEVGFPV